MHNKVKTKYKWTKFAYWVHKVLQIGLVDSFHMPDTAYCDRVINQFGLKWSDHADSYAALSVNKRSYRLWIWHPQIRYLLFDFRFALNEKTPWGPIPKCLPSLRQRLGKQKSSVKPHITVTSLLARLRLRSPASRLFTQAFILTQIRENIKVLRHWPLCREFTGDRWIPCTNGQLRGKCFHLMTSSWQLWCLLCCAKKHIDGVRIP